MNPVDNATILKQLHWRYAVKKFDATKKIPADDWTTLENALVLTPSSYGLQPWKFLVVTDPAVKAKLPAISWGQRQVEDASHVVVFAILEKLGMADVDRYMARIAEVRGGTIEALAPFRGMLANHIENPPVALDHWASLQLYIALGNFMTTAAFMGIDTCPMEGIEPAKYDDLLGLKGSGYKTIVVAVAGYRDSNDKYAQVAKVRFRPEDVIQHI